MRLSNVYGFGMTNNIFNHIYNEFMNNNSLIKINNAHNIRDFIHVSDICAAILVSVKKIKHGVFNVSTGIGTSISDLCDIFAKNLKFDSKDYKIKSASQDDTILVLDCNKFCNNYKWKPIVDLNTGVKDWIKKMRKST